jgi:hypothetical protein
VLDHLKAQDDVILAILRRLEAVGGVAPDEAQIAAEKKLREVAAREERVVRRTVSKEEKAAGLD